MIRYANVWEDSELLVNSFSIQQNHKVISIASGGGDNSFATLLKDPELVVTVDVNPSQLYLTELKKEAIRVLDFDEFLSFIGFRDISQGERIKIFSKIKGELSAEARSFWERNSNIIRSGVVYSGKLERYLRRFAVRILPRVHNQTLVDQFFYPKIQSDQEAFYKGCWDTWRWRFIFKIYFSKFMLSRNKIGSRVPKKAYPNVSQTLLDKAQKYFSAASAGNNWMLHYSLYGEFGTNLPYYVQMPNYYMIKDRIDNLVIEKGQIKEIATKYGKFDRFNLSSIFEYMDDKTLQDTTGDLALMANPGSKFAYWNLFAPRYMHKSNNHFIRLNKKEKRQNDKGFFYNDFIIDEYVY